VTHRHIAGTAVLLVRPFSPLQTTIATVRGYLWKYARPYAIVHVPDVSRPRPLLA